MLEENNNIDDLIEKVESLREYEKYEELMESTVVYDKCGLTTLRKERANAFYTGHEKRVFDVVTYNPPIIEKVLKRYE